MDKATIRSTVKDAEEWARGCPQCQFGVVKAQPLTGVVSLYLERIVQMLDGEIEFCSCQAGTRYKANLMNINQAMVEEAKANPKMAQAAQHNTHPDIQNARNAIINAILGQAPADGPTIRYEGNKA